MHICRRPGHPIDKGISVIIDLPHAADHPAHPARCSLTDAATHEPIHAVIGLSLHMDINSANPDIWIIAEQIVDEQGEPLRPGTHLPAQSHPEYFSPALPTALFRYRVAGFTTGPRLDQSTGWHPALAEQTDEQASADAKGMQVFHVGFRTHPKKSVAAYYFDFGDGFVRFYGLGGNQIAAYSAEDVTTIDIESSATVLTLDDATQRRALRSAVAWELERTAQTEGSGYRHQLARLAGLLAVPRPGEATETAEAEADDADTDDEDEVDAPNQRTRDTAQQWRDVLGAPQSPRGGYRSPHDVLSPEAFAGRPL